MKTAIFLTAVFTASLMLNWHFMVNEREIKYLSKSTENTISDARMYMTAENLPHNPEFQKLIQRLNQLPVKGAR